MAVGQTATGQLFGRPPSEIVSRVVALYRQSAVRYPREADPAVLERLIGSVIVSLAESLHTRAATGPIPLSSLQPGSALAREPEKSAALVGAILAATGDSGFDVMALCLAVRDALVEIAHIPAEKALVGQFGEWLAAVAIDAFASARASAERERARQDLEDGLPVVLVTPDLPATFLVGRLDGDLVDSALSRLLLMVVRTGARSALIDVTGLSEPGRPDVVAAVMEFARHRKIAGAAEIVVIGLSPADERGWQDKLAAGDLSVVFESHFDRAVDRALARAGYRLLRQ